MTVLKRFDTAFLGWMIIIIALVEYSFTGKLF